MAEGVAAVKIITPGSLIFTGPRSVVVSGWTFDVEGAPLPPAGSIELHRVFLKACLLHIAQVHEIALAPAATPAEPVERVAFDIERAAADVIAMARWSAKP